MTTREEIITRLVVRLRSWIVPYSMKAKSREMTWYADCPLGIFFTEHDARNILAYALDGTPLGDGKPTSSGWVIERWYGQGGPYYWTLCGRGDGRRIVDKTGSWLALRADAFHFPERDDAEAMLQFLGGIGRVVEASE